MRQLIRDRGPSFSTNQPAWSPNGKHLAFAGGSIGTELYVSDVSGRNVRKVGTHKNTCSGVWPSWSPDSKRIAFERCTQDPNAGRRSGFHEELHSRHRIGWSWPAHHREGFAPKLVGRWPFGCVRAPERAKCASSASQRLACNASDTLRRRVHGRGSRLIGSAVQSVTLRRCRACKNVSAENPCGVEGGTGG
jgi:WD40-like Beta Propeller Repeat